MNSPIDMIQQGIEETSWPLVCKGFTLMTGRQVAIPTPSNGDAVALLSFLDGLHYSIGKTLASSKTYPCPMAKKIALGEMDDAPELMVGPSVEEEPSLPQEPGPEDFRINHAKKKKGKERVCQTEDFDPKAHTNKFEDDLTQSSGDIVFNKMLPKKASKRREPVEMVSVTCFMCKREEEIPPDLVPRRVDKDDDDPKYKCNDCTTKPQRGR